MNSFKRPLMFGLAALAMCTMANTALAQEAAAGQSWIELFRHTGWVGWLMVIVSITGTALTIENFVNIRRDKLAPPSLAQELEALIEEEQFDDAIELCDEEGGYLAHLIGAALRMREAGYNEMIAGLDSAANEEQFKLNTKISYLSLLGNLAPLLGLLGTVTGMMGSFSLIGGDLGAPGAITGGIAEALIATAFGLGIAITALLPFNFLNAKLEDAQHEIDAASTQLELLMHPAVIQAAPPMSTPSTVQGGIPRALVAQE